MSTEKIAVRQLDLSNKPFEFVPAKLASERKPTNDHKFLNNKVSIPLCSWKVKSLFISNAEKAAGFNLVTAEKLFTELKGERKSEGQIERHQIIESFDNVSAAAKVGGASLMDNDGVAIAFSAEIENGVWKFQSKEKAPAAKAKA